MKTKTFFTALLPIFCATCMWASDTSVGGIWYDFDNSTMTAIVTYRGTSAGSFSNEYSDTIIIPANVTYNGKNYRVTSIGEYAFYDCRSLTSVTIGSNVTSIGNRAFYSCSYLISIYLESSTPPALGLGAYGECYVFYAMTSLESIYVPCGSLQTYKNANGWSDGRVTSKLKYIPAAVSVVSSDNQKGEVSYPQTICENTIAATPKYGYHFTRWTDGNSDNPRTIDPTQNKTYTAEFVNNTYIVTTAVNDALCGKVEGGKSALYLDQITLEAIPYYGYHFDRWNDNNKSNPRTITVTKDETYTATFAKNKYSITKIADNTQGSISGLSQAEYLDQVTLTAEPKYGYHFALWSDGVTDNPRIFELTCDTIFTAEFAKNSYSITTASSNPEWGTAAGDAIVLYQEQAEISASAYYGYHFVCWNDNNTINPRTILVTKDETYTATFAKNIYTITKVANNGLISGENRAEYLEHVALTPIPNYGYHFIQWSDGNTDNPRTIELTRDTTFTAEFAIDKSGTCGDNNALTWQYNSDTKTLTISGQGNLCTNKRYGIEAANELNSLIIEDGVQAIGDSAFFNMATLASVSISNSVTSIGTRAFQGCSSLPSITIPENVTSLGAGATFLECPALTSVQWNAKNCTISMNGSKWTPPFYLLSNLTHFAFGEDVESIPAILCAGLNGLTSIEIPEKVKSIGIEAFNGCRGLISIILPDNLVRIDNFAFAYCTGITSVVIPKNITNVGNAPFYGCTNLTSVECETLTPPIGNNVFNFCSNLSSIYVPCGTLDAYKQSWSNYADMIRYHALEYTITGNVNIAEAGNVTIPPTACDDTIIVATPNYGYHFVQWSDGVTDNPRTIELTQDTAFTAEFAISRTGSCGDDLLLTWTYDPGKKHLIISGEGTLNSNYTFGLEAPTNIQKLEIQSGVTSIGNSAFANETNLTSLSISNTVTSIGDYAFIGCKKLAELTIPASVTSIGKAAFMNGNRLETIKLGAGIETIGDSAFANCPYILSVYAYMEYPPVIDASVFVDDGELSYVDLYVPTSSFARYRKTAVWREFNLQNLPETPTGVCEVHSSDVPCTKILRNGQIFILRGNKTYAVTGQEVK